MEENWIFLFDPLVIIIRIQKIQNKKKLNENFDKIQIFGNKQINR